MDGLKELYTFKTDDEFHRLSFPLNLREIKALEEDIVKKGNTPQIRIWNSYIVMDFEKYEICRKHNIPFSVSRIPLKERIEVIALICQLHIKERNMTETMWRYLVGKRYDCERLLVKHTPDNFYQRKRGRPSLGSHAVTFQYDGSNLATRQRLGEEYHISEATVFKYGFFAQRIDELYKYVPLLASYIQMGKIRISQEQIAELIKMTPQKLKELSGMLIESNGRCKSYTKVREILDEYIPLNTASKTENEPQLFIKTTPNYDPDLEISSLALTIPSWISTINRTQKSVHNQNTSSEKRNVLIAQLLNLQTAISDLINIVKEI